MDTLATKHSDRILRALQKLFPKSEMHRILDDVAGKRMPANEFRTFVWHKMAKAGAQKVIGRPWERVDGDVRHAATTMAVLYAMHCVYERSAKGRSDLFQVARRPGYGLGARRQLGASLAG